jgi:hypothetical protein
VTTLLDIISFEGKALHKFSRGFREEGNTSALENS